MSSESTSLAEVLEFTLKEIESQGEFFDVVAVAEEIYPFRDKNIVEEMIKTMNSGKSDTIYAAWEEKELLGMGIKMTWKS